MVWVAAPMNAIPRWSMDIVDCAPGNLGLGNAPAKAQEGRLELSPQRELWEV